MNLISIVIPVKNRLELLQRALKSVFNQTYQHFEVLVVDNGSDINQKANIVSNQYDERFVFLSENNGNGNAARKLGIATAKGQFIAFLDSDDEWKPDHLESCLKTLTKSEGDLVYGGVEINNGDKVWEMKSWQKPHNQSMLMFYCNGGTAPTPSLFGKTGSIKTINWDESLNRHQDYDFCIRFSEKFKMVYRPEITVIVHWNNNDVRGMTITDIKNFTNKHGINNNQQIQNKYFLKLLRNRAWGNCSDTKRYIIHEAWKYPRYSSFVSYKESFDLTGKAYWLRIKYVIKVLGL